MALPQKRGLGTVHGGYAHMPLGVCDPVHGTWRPGVLAAGVQVEDAPSSYRPAYITHHLFQLIQYMYGGKPFPAACGRSRKTGLCGQEFLQGFFRRVWDAVTAVVLAAVVLVLMWKELGEGLFSGFGGLFSNVWLWVGVGALLLLIAVFVLASRLLRERGGIWGKVWGFIRGLGEGLSSFSHMKNAWAFILYTVLIWLFYWIMSCCIVWALEDIPAFSALDIWDAFVIAVVGSISSVVPVPGGFGAYHGVVAGILLSVWNIPIGTGMIFATLAHESQALAQAVCGLASYIHESFFRRS